MATPLISYPFRLTPVGTVATVDDGTDEQLSQELIMPILTRAGERPLVPDYGLADPAFVGFEADALRLHVELFGPPVEIEQVDVRFLDDRTQDVVVHFSS